MVRRHSVRRYLSAAPAPGLRTAGGGHRNIARAGAPLRHRHGLRAGSGDAFLDGVEAERQSGRCAGRGHRLFADLPGLPLGEGSALRRRRLVCRAPPRHADRLRRGPPSHRHVPSPARHCAAPPRAHQTAAVVLPAGGSRHRGRAAKQLAGRDGAGLLHRGVFAVGLPPALASGVAPHRGAGHMGLCARPALDVAGHHRRDPR